METLHIGDSVTFRSHVYLVRGMSPMGVSPSRVELEDPYTGEHIEACADDIQKDVGENDRRVDSTDPA
jgi:hypothetical protein